MPIIITSKSDKFRRCGMAHPKEATTHPDGTFTEEQLVILQAEPMLTVQVIAAEEEKGKGAPLANRPNVADSIAAIKAAATLDELNKLAEGEERKTVLPAIEARRAELQG